jgi:hypothetical protein
VRTALLSVAAVFAAVVVAAVGGGSHPGKTAQTSVSVSVIQMYRSVTVSPSAVSCAHYGGGGAGNTSTTTALGFPNGHCSVGTSSGGGNLPLTVSYDGPPGEVQVKGSNAVPGGGGAVWRLCGPGTCKGVNGSPGKDQIELQTIAQAGQPPMPLTGGWECDAQFNPAGFCLATRGMSQHEGVLFTGPSWTDNPSSSWTFTITWIATPQPS